MRRNLPKTYFIKNESGAILLISLWILIILSMLAIGLGHQLSLEIKLLHNNLDSVKAFYVAKAGMKRAIAERILVLQSQDTIYADSFNQSWLNNEEIFKGAKFGDGVYTVENQQAPTLYGMSDEQGKININTASEEVLRILFKQFGLIDESASEVIAAIKAWRGDKDSLDMDDYYQAQDPPYHCKKSKFDAIEEILLVKGVTPEIFYGIDTNENGIIDFNEVGLKGYITVYGDGTVNINTAPEIVLKAALGNEIIANYILEARRVGKWFTTVAVDDKNSGKVINISGTPDQNLGSDADRDVLWALLQAKVNDKSINVVSCVFRIKSEAGVAGISRVVEAVIEFENNENGANKDKYKFLYWQQA